MITYTPTTTAGAAALDAANEVLADLETGGLLDRVPLPGAASIMRPMLVPFALDLIQRKASELVATIDADPDAARAAALPALRRVVAALGIQAVDLYGAPASLTAAVQVAGDEA